jgi:signal transduction histidine kinase
MACAGLFATLFVSIAFFEIRLDFVPIFCIAGFIAFYNAVFGIAVRRLANEEPGFLFLTNLFLIDNLQISLDLVCLTALIHFSGGVENPFIFYFVFHTVISSILLPRRTAFFQATLTVGLFLTMVALEYTGLAAHHEIGGLLPGHLYNVQSYVIGTSFVFVSTLYISLYFATSVSKRLKDHEKYLADANALLEEKDKIKSEYVLRVSHDIKGHIAAIQSCIDPVLSGITGPLNPGQKNLLDRADERSSKLMAFVKSLLNLTIMRLKENSDTGVFDLAAMAVSAFNFVKLDADEKRISLEMSVPEIQHTLTASKSEMNATLIELLTNAIRYTPTGGLVRLSCRHEEHDFVIEIKDSGIGIPAKDLEQIFNEFYRAPNAKKVDSSSSGLGLAMAKHVIEKAGGRIAVVSKEGAGSAFRIMFPVSHPKSA